MDLLNLRRKPSKSFRVKLILREYTIIFCYKMKKSWHGHLALRECLRHGLFALGCGKGPGVCGRLLGKRTSGGYTVFLFPSLSPSGWDQNPVLKGTLAELS